MCGNAGSSGVDGLWLVPYTDDDQAHRFRHLIGRLAAAHGEAWVHEQVAQALSEDHHAADAHDEDAPLSAVGSGD